MQASAGPAFIVSAWTGNVSLRCEKTPLTVCFVRDWLSGNCKHGGRWPLKPRRSEMRKYGLAPAVGHVALRTGFSQR